MSNLQKDIMKLAVEVTASSMKVYSSVAYFSSTRHHGLSDECDWAQELVLSLKKGSKSSLQKGAKIMSKHPGLRGFDGIVTAAPRSKTGRPSNMALARFLVSSGVGTTAEIMVARKTPVESSRVRRHRGLGGVSFEEHVESMAFEGIASDEPVLIVDDVFTTGGTLKASAEIIRKAGHTGPIIGATLGWYVADPGKYKICPVKHVVNTV